MASRTFLSAFRPAAMMASRQTMASRSIASTAILRHKEDSIRKSHACPSRCSGICLYHDACAASNSPPNP